MIEKLGYLKWSKKERIFDVKISDDKKTLIVTEACDAYYEIRLTKDEVIELGRDFLKLADEMIYR